jgi:hypothetical protein
MRTGSCLACVAAACAVLAATGSPASAQERLARVRLEWEAIDGCLDATSLRAQTEEALGRPAFSDDKGEADLVLRGRAGRVGDGFEAVVTLALASGQALGTRTLTSAQPTCDALSSGLPLALALMIDLPLREATVRVTLPTPASAVARPPPAPAPRPMHAALDVGPIVRFGSVPVVALGARAATEVDLGRWPVGIEAHWFAPSLIDDGVVAARVWAVTGAVLGCPLHLVSRRAYASACATVEAGTEVADGVRAAVPRSDIAALVLVGARLRGGIRFASPWTLGLELGGAAFVVRPRLAYDVTGGGSAVLAEAWPAVLDASVTLGLRIP